MEKSLEQIRKEKLELEETVINAITKFLSDNPGLNINIDCGLTRIEGYGHANYVSVPFFKLEIVV